MKRAIYISAVLAFTLDAAAQFEVTQIGRLSHSAISESSGLVASRRYPGILWTHNDGGQQFLFAVDQTGKMLSAFSVPGNLIDWEDIAIDKAGNLYLADTGSNGMVRTHVAIHRVTEPNPYRRYGNARLNRSWYLRFPEGRIQDCEALFVHGGFGYLINKRTPVGVVSMYRFSLGDRRRSIPLQRVSQIALESPVTAADLSVDGQRLALTTSDGIYLFFVNGSLASSGSVTPMYFDFRDDFMEGGTFFRNGFLASSEKRQLWFFKDPAFRCQAPARLESRMQNTTVPAGTVVRFEVTALGCPTPQFAWRFNGQPIPGVTNSLLDLLGVSPADAGAYEVAVFNRYGGETNSALLNVLLRADIRITEVMSSPTTDAAFETGDWWEITNFEPRQMDLSGWRVNDSVGGLTDPFVLPAGVLLEPGETLILVENLSPEEFRVWWGDSNIPAGARILTYTGSGLSFRSGGDTIFLWDNIATDPQDYVTRADFGPADSGVTFIYNPDTNLFGDKSQVGVHGAVKAETSSDIGSPGRISQ
jgi:hypothetical protein